jgi:predicted MPP superfamily phosphohydrolase
MGFKFQMLMAATIAAAILQISGVDAKETEKKHSKIEDVKKYTRHLKFHKDGSFRVLQLSDIYVDGNAENFLNTQALIENLILKEEPDLVVITGDTVKTDSADGYQGHFESALEKLKSAGIPWV